MSRRNEIRQNRIRRKQIRQNELSRNDLSRIVVPWAFPGPQIYSKFCRWCSKVWPLRNVLLQRMRLCLLSKRSLDTHTHTVLLACISSNCNTEQLHKSESIWRPPGLFSFTLFFPFFFEYKVFCVSNSGSIGQLDKYLSVRFRCVGK